MQIHLTYLIPLYLKHIYKLVAKIIFSVTLLLAVHHCNAQTRAIDVRISSKLKLPRFIGDNMVLQCDKPVIIWGWASSFEKVNIAIGKEKYEVVTDGNGIWKSSLAQKTAGGPYTIHIKTSQDSIVLKNVMFGDVWICSGQSNMQFEVKKVNNAAQEIQEANYPLIRLLQVGRRGSQRSESDISSGKWQECNAKTVSDFSAVGYFFGRDLSNNIKVPIGLIDVSYGGTAIEAWMSADQLQKFPQKQQKLNLIQSDPDYIANKVKQVKIDEQIWLKKFHTETGQIDSTGNLVKHPDENNWVPVTLPGFINDQKIPVQFGISWYRKQFSIPENHTNQSWELNIGQITEVSLIYLNGHKLGESLSRYAENKFSVPASYLRAGENELLIYAINEAGTTGFPGNTKIGLTGVENRNTLYINGQWSFKQQTIHGAKELLGPHPSTGVVSTDYTFLYNGMIAPLGKINVKGVIWYQGETNANKPDEYEFLLSDLIKGWKSLWSYPDMPFYIVQLANYNAFVEKQKALAWARLQEVQKNVAFSTKNSGLAVTYDIGNADNIHPKDKQDVGKRLSLIVRKGIYKENSLDSYGPIFKNAISEKDSLILSFEKSSSAMINSTNTGTLNNFMIAGADKVFYPATAVISGIHVVAFSNHVLQPVYIRYAFDCNPVNVNFYNSAGLPAVPFRTDNLSDWLQSFTHN